MQLKLPKPDKDLLARRAQLAGLSYSEYVMALLRNEPVDETGRPVWFQPAAPTAPADDELPLAM